VRRHLYRLQAFDILLGSRGAPATDLEALADLASKVAHLLVGYRDPKGRAFDLIELNPVVAGPDGAIALDAIAHLA